MRQNRNICLHYVVGVELGQGALPTAIAIIEQETHRRERWGVENHALRLRYLDRLPLDATYLDAAERTRKLVAGLVDKEQAKRPDVIVGLTGTGRVALQLFKDAGLRPLGVTIMGGTDEEQEPDKPDFWRVAKTTLVGTLQIHFQAARLKVSDQLPLADLFVRELQTFKLKPPVINGNDPEAWREGPQDDLVFAAALAGWRCERHRPTPKAVDDEWTRANRELQERTGRAIV